MKVIRIAGFFTAVCLLLSLTAVAQDEPGKPFAQKIWSGWATMNSGNQAQFYASGPHVFFDDEPLKYDNWEDYRKTTAKEFEKYKSAKFTVNDDFQIHKVTDSLYWGTSTVDAVEVKKDGKEEKGTLRWTFVMEKKNGKWLIVHEHVSAPVG